MYGGFYYCVYDERADDTFYYYIQELRKLGIHNMFLITAITVLNFITRNTSNVILTSRLKLKGILILRVKFGLSDVDDISKNHMIIAGLT